MSICKCSIRVSLNPVSSMQGMATLQMGLYGGEDARISWVNPADIQSESGSSVNTAGGVHVASQIWGPYNG